MTFLFNYLKAFGAGTTSLVAFGTSKAIVTNFRNGSIPVKRQVGDSILMATLKRIPDLGTMYQTVSKLAGDNSYSYSFLNNRIKNMET